MLQSHSHADLHKVGAQQTEGDLDPTGVCLRVPEEEEELVAVGGGPSGEMILLDELGNDKLSSNGVIPGEYQHQLEQELHVPDSVALESLSAQSETEFADRVERMSDEGPSQAPLVVHHEHKRLQGDHNSDQGLPPSDEPYADVVNTNGMNPFKEDETPPPEVGISMSYYPMPTRGGQVKTGLATPHMLRSAWEVELEEVTQVTYQTPVRQSSVAESPGRDSHFLEDFID